MSQTGTGKPFLDVSASDIIGSFLQFEQLKFKSELDRMQGQAETQNSNVNAWTTDSPDIAADIVPPKNSSSFASYVPLAISGLLAIVGLSLFAFGKG